MDMGWGRARIHRLLRWVACGSLLAGVARCSTREDTAGFDPVPGASVEAGIDAAAIDGQSGGGCPLFCLEVAYSVLDLSCLAMPTSVQLTGPCAPEGDASPLYVVPPNTPHGGSGPPGAAGFGFACAPVTAVPFSQCKQIYFAATEAGVCHVNVAFEGGYTFAKDVSFFLQSDSIPGCPSCAPYIAPATPNITVNIPSTSCEDAGGPMDGASPDAAD
jgi:hypothetical protein